MTDQAMWQLHQTACDVKVATDKDKRADFLINHLKRYLHEFWPREEQRPCFIAVDDWDLNPTPGEAERGSREMQESGAWFDESPMYFRDLQVLSKGLRGFLAAQGAGVSTPVSTTIYREIPVKLIFRFTRGDAACSGLSAKEVSNSYPEEPIPGLAISLPCIAYPTEQENKVREALEKAVQETVASSQRINEASGSCSFLLSRSRFNNLLKKLENVPPCITDQPSLNNLPENVITKIVEYAQSVLGWGDKQLDEAQRQLQKPVCDVLLVIQSVLSALSGDVEAIWYIPARGFATAEHQRELCGGGICLWCDSEVSFDPLVIQTCETIRGLRQGALDWAARAHQMEWQQIIYSTGHAIGESLHTMGTCITKAQQAAEANDMAQVKDHLARASAAKAASVGMGFMSHFLAQASKGQSAGYFWATPSRHCPAEPLCLSEDFLRIRLQEAVEYAAASARTTTEAAVQTWLAGFNFNSLPVYWEGPGEGLWLFRIGENNPSPVELTASVGGAVWAAVTEPLINAARHNNRCSPYLAIAATGDADGKRIRVVILNRRNPQSEPVRNLIETRAEAATQRGKVGLTLMGLTLKALNWRPILAWEGDPDPTWYPCAACQYIPFDFSQPYQVMGFEAFWDPAPQWK